MFCFPSPHLKQAVSPLNNHTVLEHGTMAKKQICSGPTGEGVTTQIRNLCSQIEKEMSKWAFIAILVLMGHTIQSYKSFLQENVLGPVSDLKVLKRLCV